MNIYNYFLEIRNRLLLLIFTWVSVLSVSYYYKEILLFIITNFSFFNSTYTNANEVFFYFIFTDITEIFSVYITLIIFIGNQILVFYFFYNLFTFVVLGLYRFEYFYFKFIFKTVVFFFILSIIIFNKILLPCGWNFFSSFQNFAVLKSLTLILHFEAKLTEFIDFYITFYYICVFYFQIFVFLILFFDYTKNNLITIKTFRKLFHYFFVIFATLTTPPDVLSQLFVSLSLTVSYELLMFYLVLKNSVKLVCVYSSTWIERWISVPKVTGSTPVKRKK